MEKMTAQVQMRYYNQSDKAEAMLTAVFKNIKGITNVQFPKAELDDQKGSTTLVKEKLVTYSYTGTWRGLVDVEKATIKAGIPAALLSHAYVAIAIQPKRGFNLEGIRTALKELPGMKYVCCVKQSYADFYMDIKEVKVETLLAAATNNSCKARTITHETVILTLKDGGDVKGFVRNLVTTMKVLVVVRTDKTITIMSIRGISDVKYRRIAQKTSVKIEKIKRKS